MQRDRWSAKRSTHKMKRLIPILFVAAAFVGCSKRSVDMGSGAMEPTIPRGSKCIVDFHAYTSTAPGRFDIVVFRPPQDRNVLFCFRIVGLPGETIQITQEAVVIDGKKLTLPNNLLYIPRPSGGSQTKLSPSQYFLLGDNTSNARDSRYFGPVERSEILGKVIEIEP